MQGRDIQPNLLEKVVKGQIVTVFDFAGHMISVATTQLNVVVLRHGNSHE